METTSSFLMQLIGVYILLIGLIMMLRRKFFIHAMHDFIYNRALRFVIPALELAAGLALILTHNVWTVGPELIVTCVGWLLAIESVLYLLLPEKTLIKSLSALNNKKMYVVGGALSMALGIYLIVVGFGW